MPASASRQPAQTVRLVEVGERRLRRSPEPGDCRDVFGAGAEPLLLAAAGEERREGEVLARPHDRTGALRAADLVGGEGQHIDAERGDVDRNAARRLDRVAMDDGAGLVGDAGRSRQPAGSRRSRCWRASPRRAARRPSPARSYERPLATPASSTMPSPSTGMVLHSVGREAAAGQDRGMLGGADETGCRPDAACRRCVHSGVSTVTFASVPPLVKVTSFGVAADEPRHVGAGRLDPLPRRASLGVDRRGVADRAERREHRLARLRPERRAWRCSRGRCGSWRRQTTVSRPRQIGAGGAAARDQADDRRVVDAAAATRTEPCQIAFW